MTIDVKAFEEYAEKYRKENKIEVAEHYQHIANSQKYLDDLTKQVAQGQITEQQKQDLFNNLQKGYWNTRTKEELEKIKEHIDKQAFDKIKHLLL